MDVLALILFLLPPYVANATPPVLGGGLRMDFSKTFVDGQPLLGKGKTWRGFLAGVSAGIITAFILDRLFPLFFSFPVFWTGVLSSLGALVGDALGSFVKRRLKVSGSFQPLEQLSFIIVALVFAYPVAKTFITPFVLIVVIVVTYVVHLVANKVAYFIGVKEVPW